MVGDDNNLIEEETINNTETVINKPKARKTIVNLQYKSSDLIKIAYRLANENLEVFVNSSLQIALSLVVSMLMVAPSIMRKLNVDSLIGIVDFYDVASGVTGIFSFFRFINGSIRMIFAIMIILFLAYQYIKIWFIIIAIPDVKTGIDYVEYKKVQSNSTPSIIIMFGMQLILDVMFLLLMLSIDISKISLLLSNHILLIIVALIFFFVKNYVNFCLFEIFAKGKGVLDAMQNAGDNLLGSKNNIISKSFDGTIKIGILVFVTLLLISMFSLVVTMNVITNYEFSYTNLIYIAFSIVIMFITGYLGFVSVIYSYLVYMLNEK